VRAPAGPVRVLRMQPRMEPDVRVEPLRDGGRLLRDLDLGVGAEDRAQRADLALQDGGVAHVEGDRVDDVDPQAPVPAPARWRSSPAGVRARRFAATSSRIARFFAIASGRL
jgi:hypothetical protein